MSPLGQYVATVTAGVAAFGACLALNADGVLSVAAGVVYAAAAYYTADNPDILSGRDAAAWESGALAGVSTFVFVSLMQAAESAGVVVVGFGLTYFGFANGVAYGREGDGE